MGDTKVKNKVFTESEALYKCLFVALWRVALTLADEAKIEILNKDTTRDLHSMQKSEIQWLLA